MIPFSLSPQSTQRAVRSLAMIFLCAPCLVSRAALADEPPAEADALFKSGLEQMRAGRYEVACPMLAKSYQLDPLPGAGTPPLTRIGAT